LCKLLRCDNYIQQKEESKLRKEILKRGNEQKFYGYHANTILFLRISDEIFEKRREKFDNANSLLTEHTKLISSSLLRQLRASC